MGHDRIDAQPDRQAAFALQLLQGEELVRCRVLERDDGRQPLREEPVLEVPAHRRLVLLDGVARPEVPDLGGQPDRMTVGVTMDDAAAAWGAVAFPFDVVVLAGLPVPGLLPGPRVHDRGVDAQHDHHRVLVGCLIEILAIEPATLRHVARKIARRRLHQHPVALGHAGRDRPHLRHHVGDARDAAKRRLQIADDAGVFDVTVVVDEAGDDDPALRIEFLSAPGVGADLARVAHHGDASVSHQGRRGGRPPRIERDDVGVRDRQIADSRDAAGEGGEPRGPAGVWANGPPRVPVSAVPRIPPPRNSRRFTTAASRVDEESDRPPPDVRGVTRADRRESGDRSRSRIAPAAWRREGWSSGWRRRGACSASRTCRLAR